MSRIGKLPISLPSGVAVTVGEGKLSPESVKKILKAKDRSAAGPTAPPQGLYLNRVFYNEKEVMG